MYDVSVPPKQWSVARDIPIAKHAPIGLVVSYIHKSLQRAPEGSRPRHTSRYSSGSLARARSDDGGTVAYRGWLGARRRHR
jgi:hypothetical protein